MNARTRCCLACSLVFTAIFLNACERGGESKSAPALGTPAPAVTSAQRATVENTATPTPKPTPKERKDVRIIGVMIGSGVDAHGEIKNPTSKFHVGDTIYALVRTDGSGPDATITVRCEDGHRTLVFEEKKTITPKGSGEVLFTLPASKSLEAGEYHLMGLLDDYPAMGVGFDITK